MQSDIQELLIKNKYQEFDETIIQIKTLIKNRYYKTLKINENIIAQNRYQEMYKKNIETIKTLGLLDKIKTINEEQIIIKIKEFIKEVTKNHPHIKTPILDENLTEENLNFVFELLYNAETLQNYINIEEQHEIKKTNEQIQKLIIILNEEISPIIKELNQIIIKIKQKPKKPKKTQIIKNIKYKKNEKKINEEIFEMLKILISKTTQSKNTITKNEPHTPYYKCQMSIYPIYKKIEESYKQKNTAPLENYLKNLIKTYNSIIEQLKQNIHQNNKKLKKTINERYKKKIETSINTEEKYVTYIVNAKKAPKINRFLKNKIIILKILLDLINNRDISYLYQIIQDDYEIVLLKTLTINIEDKIELQNAIEIQNQIINLFETDYQDENSYFI